MKYLGSKQKISKYIVPIIQKYIDDNHITTYLETFVGGGNIIDKVNCANKIGVDIDKLVIDLYNETINNPKLLDTLPDFVDKELYYNVRDNLNKYPNWYRSAILLFASYNARVYGGCYGAIARTKDNKIRNYYKEALNNYKKQINKLKGIKFVCQDYKDIKDIKNILIYCDPPYEHSTGYSTDFNSNEFWEWVRKMSKDNIILISEYNAPNDFECIWEKEVKTHLNNRNKLNKIEKLFIYKGENK